MSRSSTTSVTCAGHGGRVANDGPRWPNFWCGRRRAKHCLTIQIRSIDRCRTVAVHFKFLLHDRRLESTDHRRHRTIRIDQRMSSSESRRMRPRCKHRTGRNQRTRLNRIDRASYHQFDGGFACAQQFQRLFQIESFERLIVDGQHFVASNQQFAPVFDKMKRK